ncbi:hypothetical protein DFH06DRAFT_1153232 [Mycena polygramma]|nr:hypothetical protein DFH06DRAFT_1153232 [Mycena polygramma]
MSMGFAWVVMHGVWAGTPASQLIHEFAVSWRNTREGNEDPTNEEFQTSPHNAGEIETWAAAHLTQWEDLRHGPVRLGVLTQSPQVPSLVFPAPPAAIAAPATVIEDAEMKDEAELDLSTSGAAGIPLPESNPTSPISQASSASPAAEKRGEDEGEQDASVTLGTTPAGSTKD